MKKLAWLLALMLLVVSLAPVGALAEEEITLTYAVWDFYDVYNYMADKYEATHPGIKVEILELGGTDVFMSNLGNLAAESKFPDVFQHLNLDACIQNGWFADITEYVEVDEEYQKNLFPSLQRGGFIDGKRCFYVPNKIMPVVVYLDQNVFKKENVELPPADWTWDDMINLMETMTRPDMQLWAYNSFLGILSIGPVALAENAIAEFGWDGENYHFEDGWADCITQEAEYRRLNYRADSDPNYATIMGDVWAGNSGHVAMQHDAWWTMQWTYSASDSAERAVSMIPYAVPASTDVTVSNALSFIDMGAVSSSTKHPAEAFDLLKYMSYGKEGTLAKIEAYANLKNEDGSVIYRVPDWTPMTTDEEVWDAYWALYQTNDAEYWADKNVDWDTLEKQLQRPVPLGGVAIPGFNTFLAEVYSGSDYNGTVGIEAAVFGGVADPYDYTEMLNQKGREYYDNIMKVLYDVYGTAE